MADVRQTCRRHGVGEAVGEACLRRELTAWHAGLIGPDPTPLVAAAVDAVAWMSQRFAERDLMRTTEKKRAASQKQLATATRQLQDAIKLVITARDAADAATARAAAEKADTAAGTRLLGGAAG